MHTGEDSDAGCIKCVSLNGEQVKILCLNKTNMRRATHLVDKVY